MILRLLFPCIYFGLIFTALQAQNVGIGTAAPDASAKLDVYSTSSGFLPPRLTTAQRDAIASPAIGLQIFNTNASCLEFWNGTNWVSLCATVAICTPPPTPTAGASSPLCIGGTLQLTSTPVVGATYVWSGPNGFSSTAQNPSISNLTAANEGIYSVRTWLVGCYSDASTVTATLLPSSGAELSCREILAKNPAAASGTYLIDPDGCAGPIDPFTCQCDMTTDGGGWTLVLNYLHQGGTTPATQARTTDLPLLGSTTLGDNEAATAFWGHAAPALQNTIPHTELRFWARTGAHARVIHFKTSHAGTLAYFRTGTGNTVGINTSFTALTGHTAFLPNSASTGYTDWGADAMTNFPMYESML